MKMDIEQVLSKAREKWAWITDKKEVEEADGFAQGWPAKVWTCNGRVVHRMLCFLRKHSLRVQGIILRELFPKNSIPYSRSSSLVHCKHRSVPAKMTVSRRSTTSSRRKRK